MDVFKSVLFIYRRHEGKECFMLVLLNCKKGDQCLLLLVGFSPFPEPDTLENCDLGYSTHFLLAVATQEVETVKGQWLTSPVKNTNQCNKLGIMPVN